jgi:uncharacterized protein (DUF488 family)
MLNVPHGHSSESLQQRLHHKGGVHAFQALVLLLRAATAVQCHAGAAARNAEQKLTFSTETGCS